MSQTKPVNLSNTTHIIYLLLQLDLGLGQHVDLVLLCLEVLQGLLMSLLECLLLIGQLQDGLVQGGHLLSQVLHLWSSQQGRGRDAMG